MVDHAPAFGALLKDVCRQNRCGNVLAFKLNCLGFRRASPKQATMHLDRYIGQHELNLPECFRKFASSSPSPLPASQDAPARVAAFDMAVALAHTFSICLMLRLSKAR